MSFLQAILMGIVQGATEFLPVSSFGHLAILRNFLGVSQDNELFLESLLSMGSILVLFLLYGRDILKIFIELGRIFRDISKNLHIMLYNTHTQEDKVYIKILHTNYRKFTVLLLISSIFSWILGLFLSKILDPKTTSLLTVGAGFFITGVFLIVADYAPKGHRIPKDVSWKNGIFIGVIQGLSNLSGISRTGTVASGCLLMGFNRKLAMKYTMISSIPALIVSIYFKLQATTYQLTSWKEGLFYLTAVLLSIIISFFGIHFLQNIINRKRFRIFAYYCFFVGIIAMICNFQS